MVVPCSPVPSPHPSSLCSAVLVRGCMQGRSRGPDRGRTGSHRSAWLHGQLRLLPLLGRSVQGWVLDLPLGPVSPGWSP